MWFDHCTVTLHPMTNIRVLRLFLLAVIMSVAAVCVSAQTGQRTDLWQRCERARSLCQYDSLAVYAGEMLSQARARDDERTEAYALFYQGLSQLFTGKGGGSLQSLSQSRDLAEEIENDSILALVTNAMGIYHAMVENNRFVAQQFFFRSLDYAEKARYEQLKGRVYGNLLTLTHTATDTAGLANARRIYDYGHEQHDYEQTFMGAYYQANYYNLTGDNQRAETFLREALDIYRDYPYDDVASVYTLYSKVKMDMGQTDEAERYARQAIALADSLHQPFLLPDTYLQYAEVLSRKGNPALSNAMAQRALETADLASSKTQAVACYRLMARNSRMLGQNAQAMDCLERANQLMDTLTLINMERLNHERTIMLDIQKKEQEAQLRRQQMGKPGGLADTLRTQQHQDGAVHLLLVEPPSHHADEPLLQHAVEQFLFLVGIPVVGRLHLNGHRQHTDAVVRTVPFGQTVQIGAEGVECRGIARLDDTSHVLELHRALIAHLHPLCVQPYIVDGFPHVEPDVVGVGTEVFAILLTPGHHVAAQFYTRVEPRSDLAGLGILLTATTLFLRRFATDVGSMENHRLGIVIHIGSMAQRHRFGNTHQCAVSLAVRQMGVIVHAEVLQTTVVAHLLFLAVAVVQLVFEHHIHAPAYVIPTQFCMWIVAHQLTLPSYVFIIIS